MSEANSENQGLNFAVGCLTLIALAFAYQGCLFIQGKHFSQKKKNAKIVSVREVISDFNNSEGSASYKYNGEDTYYSFEGYCGDQIVPVGFALALNVHGSEKLNDSYITAYFTSDDGKPASDCKKKQKIKLVCQEIHKTIGVVAAHYCEVTN